MSKKMQGNIMLLITAMIWGSAFVAQSKGMEFIGPFTFNVLRNFVGGIVLMPVIAIFSRGTNHSPEEKKQINKNTLIGGVFCGIVLFVASSFQQYGLVHTTAGKAGFITALYIVIVPLLGVFMGKKVPKIVWGCVALAIAGFWLLCIKEGFSVGLGDLMVLICAFFYSMHIVTIDHFSPKADCVKMSCVQFWVAGFISLIPMLLFEEPRMDAIMDAKWTVLYAGVLSSGVAYTFQIIAQRHTEPTVATLLMSLESVFAALSGWLILNETMLPKEFIGCILVFIAVIFAQIPIPVKTKK
ncbi:MAG: DMT family transporter [Oscillospiraceae bacterium]|nr:DMT family transporter [Oscillospiraceae bacterium]